MQGKVRLVFLAMHFSVRVLLRLGTILWVERVQMMVRQASIASFVAKFDSDQDLVNEGNMKCYLVSLITNTS